MYMQHQQCAKACPLPLEINTHLTRVITDNMHAYVLMPVFVHLQPAQCVWARCV